MIKIRLAITKDAEICFVSHLEYMKTIERAIKRAKLPVAYSEGFNPHMKFSLASALSVGVSSEFELCDLELIDVVDKNIIVERLSACLPKGIKIRQAERIEEKSDKLMAMVQAAEYESCMNILPDADICVDFIMEKYNSLENIFFDKKMPRGKGIKNVDIKDFVLGLEFVVDKQYFKMKFSCKITPTGSLKAQEIISVLASELSIPVDLNSLAIVRTDLYKFDACGTKQALINP